jgi:hypothetical protein
VVTDDLEDILVSIHTVHDFLYLEHGGSKLTQYTNYLPTDTTSYTGRAEVHQHLCWNSMICLALFIYKL